MHFIHNVSHLSTFFFYAINVCQILFPIPVFFEQGHVRFYTVVLFFAMMAAAKAVVIGTANIIPSSWIGNSGTVWCGVVVVGVGVAAGVGVGVGVDVGVEVDVSVGADVGA